MAPGTEDRLIDRAVWELHICNMLRSGFGVEDISLKLKALHIMPRDGRVIRAFIAKMRAEGSLMELFRRKK